MRTQTLLLITDITGFTQFVAQSDPDTGIARAQEMLQLIVDSNDLGLELCEIEGDAVFFYLKSGLPSHQRLFAQIRKTFAAFNDYLNLHQLKEMLGIKFFVHVGQCQSITVGGRTKLFGLDVIMIHRLLKGLVDDRNYVLMTRDAATVLDFSARPTEEGVIEFEHIGPVEYLIFGEEVLAQESVAPNSSESIWSQISTCIEVVSSELALRNPRSTLRAFNFPLI